MSEVVCRSLCVSRFGVNPLLSCLVRKSPVCVCVCCVCVCVYVCTPATGSWFGTGQSSLPHPCA